jgi:hypothetical protein
MKILSEVSVLEEWFKQSLRKEKMVEVVQGCMGDNHAQIADGLSQIESRWNATALELCKAMRKSWHIKGHYNGDKEDNDVDSDSMVLEASLGTVKDNKAWSGSRNALTAGR